MHVHVLSSGSGLITFYITPSSRSLKFLPHSIETNVFTVTCNDATFNNHITLYNVKSIVQWIVYKVTAIISPVFVYTNHQNYWTMTAFVCQLAELVEGVFRRELNSLYWNKLF